MKQILKYIFLFVVGGFMYVLVELFSRGYSHWTMFLLGGFCFILIGCLNEYYSWDTALVSQMFLSSLMITILEFITGIVVNIWLGWNVWDYNNLPYNFIGQISLLYINFWFWLSLLGIFLDDFIRYRYLGEEKPHYKIL